MPFTESSLSIDEIIAYKTKQITQREVIVSLVGLRALASLQDRPQDLNTVLRENQPLALIARMNANAPQQEDHSKIVYDPVAWARVLITQRAVALVVPTDEQIFGGRLEHLPIVAGAVDVPTIAQDIILNEYQVVEARASGADGVLLLPQVLDDTELPRLISLVQRHRMTAVVQVSTPKELQRALAHEPRAIAIKWRWNENLTLAQEAPRLKAMLTKIPAHITVIGLCDQMSREQMRMIAHSRVHAIVMDQAMMIESEKASSLIESIPTKPLT